MNRNITNVIRFLMDECLPPLLRDSRWFMYPFFYIAYRGKNIRQVMDYKRSVAHMSRQEYTDFYASLQSISRHRDTDINASCMNAILQRLSHYDAPQILDAGCGNGHLARIIKQNHLDSEVVCLDQIPPGSPAPHCYTRGSMDQLPFRDKEFDIVICAHVLEHCLDLSGVVCELKRVCKSELLVVVPRQRPYFYTLDEHVQFFLYEEQLTSVIGLKNAECTNLKGDWFYRGTP